MMKSMMFAAVLAAGLGSSGAQAQTLAAIQVLGSDFDVSPFEAMEASVAVATDKKTGRKFNVVKLPNGKMMALMSVDKLKAITPFSDDSEMMFGGTKGSAR